MLAIAICGHRPASIAGWELPRRKILGLILGLGAAGSMMLPVHLQPGVIFDLRYPLLAAAGFVGGPAAAMIAGALALICRLQLGGIGALGGSTGIVVVSLIGLAAHALAGRRPTRAYDVPVLAVCTTSGGIVPILLLPQSMWGAAIGNVGPIFLLNFGCTCLFVLSLRRDERHRTLIERNSIYRAIIETLPDSINAKDRDGRFLAANPATARLMQVKSPEDLIGRSDAAFYPEAMALGFQQEERWVLDNNTIGPIEQELRFKDGSRLWVTTLKTPLLDQNGHVCGIITHNRDVTDRKKLEADLRITQGYLQEAMTNMADGLVFYDREGVIRFCNDQYRNMFPKTADLRVVGQRFGDILREAVRRGEEKPKEAIEAWIAERVEALHHSGDRLIRLADGRCIEARSRPIASSGTLVVFTDVTARKQLEADLRRQASHDALTGLANRAEFDFQLRTAHQRATSQHTEFAVMMLDLDGFKQVNDTFGHPVGDKLLIEVATRLQAIVRAGDVVARLGGDEFAFLVAGSDVEAGSRRLADRVLETLHRPFKTDGAEVELGGSLGVAFFPHDSADIDVLMVLADKALYAVKADGGQNWATAAPAHAD